MSDPGFLVTGWKGGTYGLKVSIADRDTYFRRDQKSVDLYLHGRSTPVRVNISKPSFWNGTCRELISKAIGDWLVDNSLAPWPKGHPPKLRMHPRADHVFDVSPTS